MAKYVLVVVVAFLEEFYVIDAQSLELTPTTFTDLDNSGSTTFTYTLM